MSVHIETKVCKTKVQLKAEAEIIDSGSKKGNYKFYNISLALKNSLHVARSTKTALPIA
jgi:hypothetical protein